MDHIDKFFNNFILVNFAGGSMGTFLCNLLGDWDHPVYRRRVEKHGLLENFEWAAISYFDSYLFQYDEDAINVYKEKFGSDWPKYYLYAYSLVELEHMNLNRGSLRHKFMKDITNIEEHIQKIVNPMHIVFPVAKAHPDFKILTDKTINWKYRVAPYFPDNKKWLQTMLLMWKRCLCEVDGLPPKDSSHTDKFKQFYSRLNDPYTLHAPIYENRQIIGDDYKRIDMYRLVFLEDVDQLVRAMPDFVLTDNKKALLKKARDTSMEILNRLGLDHSAIAPAGCTVAEFFADTNVLDYLERYKRKYNL